MDIKACLSHKSDEWSTPKDLYDLFMSYGLADFCKLGQEEDGLAQKWCDYNYINPPFSKLSAFVDKSIEEYRQNGNKTILLMPVRTDTKYFWRLFLENTAFVFISGRLKFGDSNKCAPFPTMLILIGFNNLMNRIVLVDRKDLVDYFDNLLSIELSKCRYEI